MALKKLLVDESIVWTNLVMSALSVNRWTLTKTINIFSRLEEEGLFDVRNVRGWTRTEISTRLALSGYRRGDYLNQLIADRLKLLSVHLSDQTLKELGERATSPDCASIENVLLPIPGVGKQTVDTFLRLSVY